jgi:hypothetical protein
MNSTYKDIYEFASSAGAFEGYVYQRENLDAAYLNNWVKNLVAQYQGLPMDVRDSFQSSLDRTMGRAVQSLISAFGESHGHVAALKPLIVGKLPDAPNDFEEEKEEKADKYGK